MKIIIDSREQKPYSFQNFNLDVETVTATLPAGDYSLRGCENLIAVERKELSDIMNCLGSDRDRFFRELERLKAYEAAVIVIESPLSVIAAGRYRNHINPKSAIQSLIAIEAQYRLPIFYAKDRTAAEWYVFHFLRHYQNAVMRRYKACCTGDDTDTGFKEKHSQNAQNEGKQRK